MDYDRDVWGIDKSCIDWVRRRRQDKNLEVLELDWEGNKMWNR